MRWRQWSRPRGQPAAGEQLLCSKCTPSVSCADISPGGGDKFCDAAIGTQLSTLLCLLCSADSASSRRIHPLGRWPRPLLQGGTLYVDRVICAEMSAISGEAAEPQISSLKSQFYPNHAAPWRRGAPKAQDGYGTAAGTQLSTLKKTAAPFMGLLFWDQSSIGLIAVCF